MIPYGSEFPVAVMAGLPANCYTLLYFTFVCCLKKHPSTLPTPSGFLDASSYPALCSLALKRHDASGRNTQHARYVQHAASTCENICYQTAVLRSTSVYGRSSRHDEFRVHACLATYDRTAGYLMHVRKLTFSQLGRTHTSE